MLVVVEPSSWLAGATERLSPVVVDRKKDQKVILVSPRSPGVLVVRHVCKHAGRTRWSHAECDEIMNQQQGCMVRDR